MIVETAKPFGALPGTFSAAGAVSDTGTFANASFVFAASGAPDFVSVHATRTFDGALGSFTLRVDIKETARRDPNVLTDQGTWAVVDGDGAYVRLRGGGAVTGTADDNTGVISRTYTGTVHFD